MRNPTRTNPISHLEVTATEMQTNRRGWREPLALLKLLALGNREVEEGKVEPFDLVVDELRADLKAGRLSS